MTAQFSTLEIYVYDEEQDNLYAHHDIPLPVFPLCLQWMDFTPAHSATSSATPGAEGHVVAVGTFAPYIEVKYIPPPFLHARLKAKNALHQTNPSGMLHSSRTFSQKESSEASMNLVSHGMKKYHLNVYVLLHGKLSLGF